MKSDYEYILIGKDGKMYAQVNSLTGEVRLLNFWEKIKLLFK